LLLGGKHLKRVSKPFKGKYAHHIRISEPYEINDEVVKLLRIGFDFALT